MIGFFAFLLLISLSGCEKSERIYYDERPVDSDNPTLPVTNPNGPTYTETQEITENITTPTSLTNIHQDPTMVDYRVTLSKWEIFNELTIEPGVVLEFEKDAELFVAKNAQIRSYAYEQLPIRFTCKEKTAGSWIGIVGDVESRIIFSYAIVEYAGGTLIANELGGAAIKTEGIVGLQGSELKHSGGFGLRTFGNGSFSYLAENKFLDNTNAAIITSVDHLHTVQIQTEFARNGHDGVQITSSVFEDGPCPEPWETLTVNGSGSYLIQNLDPADPAEVLVETNLQIFPGVTVHFGEDASLKIKANVGMLTAIGTAAFPITFEGKRAEKGSWKGIFLEQSLETSYMDYVTVKHGGSEVFDGDSFPYKGNIGVNNAALTISNSTIADSEGCAFASNGGQNSVIVETNNTYNNNDGGQFCGL